VVVVSAMAKVTDQLLRAAEAAAQGDRTGALAISSRLRARHRDTAIALVKNQAESAELVDFIDQKFDSLDEVLRGLAAILELTPRISDLIVSYGERVSSRIVAAAFRERGIDAAHVDAREVIITDSQFQKAIPQDELIEKRAAEKLLPLVQAGQGAGDGRLHRRERGRHYHHAGPRRLRLYRRAGGRRAAARGHRDLDRRGRHHDLPIRASAPTRCA
jgi:aspartate kinase